MSKISLRERRKSGGFQRHHQFLPITISAPFSNLYFMGLIIGLAMSLVPSVSCSYACPLESSWQEDSPVLIYAALY